VPRHQSSSLASNGLSLALQLRPRSHMKPAAKPSAPSIPGQTDAHEIEALISSGDAGSWYFFSLRMYTSYLSLILLGLFGATISPTTKLFSFGKAKQPMELLLKIITKFSVPRKPSICSGVSNLITNCDQTSRITSHLFFILFY
jgi:hypothetical protein